MDVTRHLACDGTRDLLKEACGDDDADRSGILLEHFTLDGKAMHIRRGKRDFPALDFKLTAREDRTAVTLFFA